MCSAALLVSQGRKVPKGGRKKVRCKVRHQKTSSKSKIINNNYIIFPLIRGEQKQMSYPFVRPFLGVMIMISFITSRVPFCGRNEEFSLSWGWRMRLLAASFLVDG